MNWDIIEGKWKQMKGEAQTNWGRLTDEDIDRADGNREVLEGILQEKYGKTKDDIRKEVDTWMRSVA